MKTLAFPGLTPCALAAAIALMSSGCKREAADIPPTQARPRPARPALQAELNALRKIPADPVTANRPLTVSQQATTERDWALGALRDGYFRNGDTNSQWDAAVLSAFEAYSDYSRNQQPDRLPAITTAVATAQVAGCKDPMIQYLRARYFDNPTDEAFAIALVKGCGPIMTSQHHPAFKFNSAYRAITAARTADGKGDRAALQLLVNISLVDLARDSNAPPAEVFQSAFEWLEYTRSKGWADFVMGDLDGFLETNWPSHPLLFCLRGSAELRRAWEARGGSWANTVSDQGWEGFREHLDKAETFLAKSWDLCPTNALTAYRLMQLELGQGRGLPIMEKWFNHAMALAPNYYDAAQLMSFYLEPRWYGSEEKALEFARSCVANQAWKGQVPLVLPHLHHSLATFYRKTDSPDYWERRAVWNDIRSAYERFFTLNPDAVGWRHDYARDAYLCGQYSVFLAQTKLFTGGTNHAFFGGEAKFRNMLRKAAAAPSTAAN